MSNNTHKSAAVPFVNQKGERSMKRVKVPRYFAGKRPAYAKEEDEEEEYITDDEEDLDENQEYGSDEEEEEDDEVDSYQVSSGSRQLDHFNQDSDDDEDDEDDEEGRNDKKPNHSDTNRGDKMQSRETPSEAKVSEEDEDEEDDPRFRRLKQIESKTSSTDLINVQRTQQIQSNYEFSKRNIILDEEDDEEQVRQRHALARRRKLEEPLGPQAVIGDQQQDLDDEDEEVSKQSKRLDTDDILKDLKLTGISRPTREKYKTEAELEAEQRRLKESLEQAKQQATLTSQTYRKVDEDIRKEREREALAKGDIGAREMSSVLTDDEDEELAYEEWKFREIKRVQRDRAERALLAAKAR